MTKTVTFPLSEGLPPGTWAVLRRGSEWIDRRFLSVAWGRGVEPGVEVAVEATTRLESLVSARERQQVEFKRQLPNDDTKPKLMKTVCAFANGDGGSILIGVDDDRNLVGVDPGSVDRLGDQLTQTIGSWVAPRPPIDFNVLPIPDSDKVVLELIVKPGTELYASGRAGETRTAYVRYHGLTEKAHPAEIIAIVRTRTPGNPTLGWQPGS